jgi:exodeoxyribonuclease VII small subunit
MSEPERPAQVLEASLRRLETIVAALERGELELEASLALFEEGVAHLRAAQAILRESELRISRLLGEVDGEPLVVPLEPELQ